METTEQRARQRAGLPERSANQCSVCDVAVHCNARCHNDLCQRCCTAFCLLPNHAVSDVVFAYARKNHEFVSFHNIGGRELIMKINGSHQFFSRFNLGHDAESISFAPSSNIWNSMESWARNYMVNDQSAVRFGERPTVEPSIYEELPDPEYFGYISFDHASKCEAVKIARERIAYAQTRLSTKIGDDEVVDYYQRWQKELAKREAELRISIAAYDRFRVRHSDELRSLQIASDLGTLPTFYDQQRAEKRARMVIAEERKASTRADCTMCHEPIGSEGFEYDEQLFCSTECIENYERIASQPKA